MDINRREFIKNALKLSGGSIVALYSLGIKPEEIYAMSVDSQYMMSGSSTVSSGCDTLEQSGGSDTADAIINDTKTGIAHSFVASDTYTLCKTILSMWRTSTPSQDTVIELYSSDDGGTYPLPNAKLADITTVLTSSLGTSSGNVEISSLNLSLTSGVRYHIVFWNSGCDATNQIRVDRASSGTEAYSSYNGSWSTSDGSSTLVYDHYR